MPQQCVHLRRSAAKRNKGLQCWPAAAHGKDFLPETRADIGVQHTLGAACGVFLKHAVGVCG